MDIFHIFSDSIHQIPTTIPSVNKAPPLTTPLFKRASVKLIGTIDACKARCAIMQIAIMAILATANPTADPIAMPAIGPPDKPVNKKTNDVTDVYFVLYHKKCDLCGFIIVFFV